MSNQYDEGYRVGYDDGYKDGYEAERDHQDQKRELLIDIIKSIRANQYSHAAVLINRLLPDACLTEKDFK